MLKEFFKTINRNKEVIDVMDLATKEDYEEWRELNRRNRKYDKEYTSSYNEFLTKKYIK